MTKKHYFEIKQPNGCPNRYDDRGMGMCRVKEIACLDRRDFPSWCPLKVVEE